MPEYLAPGVYVEEVEAGPKPIEGVSTSTAGFIGPTERGPINPTFITSIEEFERIFGGYLADSFMTYAVDGFFRNGGKRCFIGRITKREETSEAAIASFDLTGNIIRVTAVGPGAWGNNIFIKIGDASLQDATHPNLFKLTVVYFPEGPETSAAGAVIDPTDPANRSHQFVGRMPIVEVHDNLSPGPARDPSYYGKIVNGVSNLIFIWDDMSAGTPLRPANFTTLAPLTGGTNGATGSTDIVLTDYRGGPRQITNPLTGEVMGIERTGLSGFEGVDEIAILCAPDEGSIAGLRGDLIDHCEKLLDRFAVLQAKDTDASNIGNLRPDRESKYAAIYFPWISVIDPLTQRPRLIPPGGHVAGIFARSDTERGVHKAPANEQVRGATSLQVQLTKEQQGLLNPRGINAIRAFPGRGIILYGARTISADPNWKYVNVRRLFIFIEESIEEGTQWVVFDSNNEGLWARVRATVIQFLTKVWRDGALMGTTAEQAFFVKCDRTTMTQDDIDNGRLIVKIGIAPVKPAEFVIFRISQSRLGAGITEG
jgi:phage tail sheath protein FI